MALNPTLLSDEILNDSLIIDDIPLIADPRFTVYTEQTAIAITNQVQRGLDTIQQDYRQIFLLGGM